MFPGYLDHSTYVRVECNDFVVSLRIHTISDYVCQVSTNQLSSINGLRWFIAKQQLLEKGYKVTIIDPSKRLEVGFTGTKTGLTFSQKQTVKFFLTYILQKYSDYILYFRHGECIGADEQAQQIAEWLDYRIIIHPPLKDKFRSTSCRNVFSRLPEKDYLERNRDIVNHSHILIGCPKDGNQLHSGTWFTINYAVKQKCPVRIVR